MATGTICWVVTTSAADSEAVVERALSWQAVCCYLLPTLVAIQLATEDADAIGIRQALSGLDIPVMVLVPHAGGLHSWAGIGTGWENGSVEARWLEVLQEAPGSGG